MFDRFELCGVEMEILGDGQITSLYVKGIKYDGVEPGKGLRS